MAKRGRKTSFNAAIAREICEKLASGRTLRDVCRDESMPAESTVRAWALDDVQGFSAQYARAREIGYYAMADELLEIADDGRNDWLLSLDDEGNETYKLNGEHVQRSRLRVDARKWALSKALPKVFGDKLAVSGDPDGAPIKVQKVERVIVDAAGSK